MSTPLPNRSIRIAPEHNALLGNFLSLLRQGRENELSEAIAELMEGRRKTVGPFRSESAALDFLVSKMVAAARPRAIWLFGSRARGDSGAGSDFDFLAVFPDDDP